MENDLFEAASFGNIDLLIAIHEKDKLVLAKFVAGCFNWSPLLVAASQGHKEFVDKLLTLNPELAQALDSQNRSGLHMAAAKGHIEVVKVLLFKLGSNICYSCDRDGRAPLHLAATNGEVQVVEELLRANAYVARARLDQDETILHLCVKHHQFSVLKILLEMVKDEDFVNAKDNRGNTLLHVAAYMKQVEVIKYVHDHVKVNMKIKNLNGQTALDILYVLVATTDDAGRRELDSIRPLAAYGTKGNRLEDIFNWLEKKDILMLVTSIIATTSFQTAVNPPGGFWQDNSNGHRAGEAVLATTSPRIYSRIMALNTGTFSISIIAMYIITACPLQKRILTKLLVFYSTGLIAMLTFTYANIISVLTPGNNFFINEKYTYKAFMAPPNKNIIIGEVMIVLIAILCGVIQILFYIWQTIVCKLLPRNQNVLSEV